MNPYVIITAVALAALNCSAQTLVTNEVVPVRISLQCTNCFAAMIHGGENRAKNIFVNSEPGTILILNPNIYQCSKCTNRFEDLKLWPKIEYIEKPKTK
jgi:hypothetical protein